MDTTTVFIAILTLAAGAFAAWGILRGRQQGSGKEAEMALKMHEQMMAQIARMQDQMERRLLDHANQAAVTDRSVRSVTATLAKLEESTRALSAKSDEIVSFQNILKSPKVRGSFGEVLLGSLLADVLPQDRYELQYGFLGGREIADAIIRLQDGYIVAVDAKFPFANYEAYMNERDTAMRASLRKAFVRDVKKHISAIAQKYISSEEKTLDYAFMYIPIEGVYYETMVHSEGGDDLWAFCLQHKVIPVSPNSFLAYLQTVLVGLRGMKIEQKTREILQYIGQLRQDFGKFAEDFSTVGRHLGNAKTKYDDSQRRLDRLGSRFDQIEIGTEGAPPLDRGV